MNPETFSSVALDVSTDSESTLMKSIRATLKVLLDRELSQGAKLLWYYICEFSFVYEFGGDKQGGTLASVDFLADWMKANHASVCRWQKELIRRGHIWIDKIPQPSGWTRNKYYMAMIVPPGSQRELSFEPKRYQELISPNFGTVGTLRRSSLHSVPPMRHAPVPATRRGDVTPASQSPVTPASQSPVTSGSQLIREKGSREKGSENPPSRNGHSRSFKSSNLEPESDASSWETWKVRAGQWFDSVKRKAVEDLDKKLEALKKDDSNFEWQLNAGIQDWITAARATIAAEQKKKAPNKNRIAELEQGIAERTFRSKENYTRGALKNGPRQQQANWKRQKDFLEQALLR